MLIMDEINLSEFLWLKREEQKRMSHDKGDDISGHGESETDID